MGYGQPSSARDVEGTLILTANRDEISPEHSPANGGVLESTVVGSKETKSSLHELWNTVGTNPAWQKAEHGISGQSNRTNKPFASVTVLWWCEDPSCWGWSAFGLSSLLEWDYVDPHCCNLGFSVAFLCQIRPYSWLQFLFSTSHPPIPYYPCLFPEAPQFWWGEARGFWGMPFLSIPLGLKRLELMVWKMGSSFPPLKGMQRGSEVTK